MAQVRQTFKISVLVGVWMFFTVAFLMHNEKEEVTRHSSVAPGQIKGKQLQAQRQVQQRSKKYEIIFSSEIIMLRE